MVPLTHVQIPDTLMTLLSLPSGHYDADERASGRRFASSSSETGQARMQISPSHSLWHFDAIKRRREEATIAKTSTKLEEKR